MSIEAVRGDLAAAIPSQAGSARSVSPAQAVFLATVLHLETLRAESGVVSPIFQYFKIPSLVKEAGMGDCLKSIGEKVSIQLEQRSRRMGLTFTSGQIGPFNLCFEPFPSRTYTRCPCDFHQRLSPSAALPSLRPIPRSSFDGAQLPQRTLLKFP